ncbi:isocitrate/isopropylmalate family dehydrogenase [Methanosarcina mazei]|jgi:methanogen homoisocitrate dehydrogenase|uniref:3-isopropylmalate dehydrogenase n=5 Tax=Methanosarcina mazei TaxID=2209 RepID=A0A0F8N0Q6_METMZ|nr:isocitrate/isopropylmalate family dehydrogenase [Methanosarcina mazei]AAM30338.1 Isocitrate dehydrogenase (NADP) [Methanosarcina mazei Go1]AKB60632.1 Coenzyme B synthesis from 2-oxoglutarate: steps 5, 9, and 13 [Methanosarcina mazei SarPi]AKB63863.1 Coenzyme B synthesis from 2-oxoglutarate: steps 5, 9, and 13 [Methanosarcina mazei S-6]AKB67301.1 Coenzyme B synthesis from 2-oxoglutarate: steps 5, 9, and 13 [Methanosarcina mazei LYC]KKF97946.1 isocitrate dehydrogenase [Methanosarcina mazei]
MRLAVIEGDGIGREVIPAAVEVLDAFGLEFEKVPLEIGYARWERTGTAMSEEDMEIIKSCNAVLFGAVTTVPDPGYKSVLLTIRKELDLYANVRPVKPLSGVVGVSGRSDFDFIIVRENTEGLYSGIEEIGHDLSWTKRVITRKGSERISEYACELAKKRSGKLTIVHKSNVLKSDKLFLDVCRETASSYGVEYGDMLVDSMAYSLIMHPEKYDVVVTTNLFGDILSDMCAALVGSLGLVPSANIGKKYAFFEPVHGSAPDIAGKGISNPLAAILCVKMLLEWMGKPEARLIDAAIADLLQKKIITPDLGGRASTAEVGNAVAKYIMQNL